MEHGLSPCDGRRFGRDDELAEGETRLLRGRITDTMVVSTMNDTAYTR